MFDNAPVEVLKKSSQGLFQTFKIYLSNPNNTTNKVFCIIMLKPLLKVMLLMMMMIYIYIYICKNFQIMPKPDLKKVGTQSSCLKLGIPNQHKPKDYEPLRLKCLNSAATCGGLRATTS